MGIPTNNTKLKKLTSHRLRGEQARLKNVKNIFIDGYSMLIQKELFHLSERVKQIKFNSLVFASCV